MRVIRTLAWILTFVAIGAAAAAWFTPQADVDAETAGEISLRALTDAGVEDIAVVGTPTRGSHTTGDSGTVEVWQVVVDVAGDEIDVLVDAEEGQLVYVDDLVGKNHDQRALTEDQWDSVEFYRDDQRRDDWVQRNIVGSIGAAVIVAVGFVLARRSGEAA